MIHDVCTGLKKQNRHMLVALSSLGRVLEEGLAIHSPPPPALKKKSFVFREDQLPHANSTLLGQGQSTVAQRAETTENKCMVKK